MPKELLSQKSIMKCQHCQGNNIEFWDQKKTSVFLLCPKCDTKKMRNCLRAGAISVEVMTYLDYRSQFKLCETCRLPIRSHPRCQACQILCGPGHEGHLSNYRGYKICDSCMLDWVLLESDLNRQVNLKDFKSGLAGRLRMIEGSKEKLAAGRVV